MIPDPNLVAACLNTDVAKQTYDDLISGSAKELGNFFIDVVKCARLITIPILLGSVGFDRLKTRLKSAIEQVPEKNRVIPSTTISVPIIQSLIYIEENRLADIYQNLLARAMDKSRKTEAHPGFIAVISQLSTDEALVMQKLKFNQFELIRSWELKIVLSQRRISNIKTIYNEFPLSELNDCHYFDMYLDHLEKLDLICVKEKKSDPIWNDSKIQTGGKDTLTIGLTKFGELFVKACLPD